MTNIDKMINRIDQKVDQKIGRFKYYFKRYFPVFSVTLLCLIVIFFVLRIFHKKPYFSASIIASDIKIIVQVIEKIDFDCSILSLEHIKNYVDFLNVKEFEGSEIGPLNLAYPKNWKGPYLGDNPEFQGILYQLVKIKDGIFVLPGDGVKLPTGFVVGKDFKISANLELSKMIEIKGKLNYKNIPLAVQIKFKKGDWKRRFTPEQMKKISTDFKEFYEAVPFSENECEFEVKG
ncbi:hypothetical protein KAT08_04420 [Candidatus Babeliales bacterium]|nr:hypothetical protein [Candidatus Babeliales bacterium]